VGYGTTAAGERAFIWDAPNGMRDLRDVLVSDCGLDMAGWTLTEAWDVSDNGLVVVGYGTNPSGQTEAWRAVLPEPGSCVLLLLGGAALLRRRSSSWRVTPRAAN